MSEFPTYRIEIVVTVFDAAALRRHAVTVFKKENPCDPLSAWRELRGAGAAAVKADLVMVLVPGVSPPGTDIRVSTVEPA